MRKIILGLAVSLDNFIEGPNGEYDWCFTDQDYGMTEFLKGVDAIFYGRKSYEVLMNAGENPWKDKKTYLFSNTAKPSETYELVSGDVVERVKSIKSSTGKNIWLFGGASVTSVLMKAGLVDELWLSVHPILLGKGKPLFQDLDSRIITKLLEVKQYNTGLVSLRYGLNN